MILSGPNFWKIFISEWTLDFGNKVRGSTNCEGTLSSSYILSGPMYEFTIICLLPDRTSCEISDQASIISGCTKVAIS